MSFSDPAIGGASLLRLAKNQLRGSGCQAHGLHGDPNRAAGAGGLGRWNRQDYPIADDFHTFAIEWDETGITWFYDDEEYYTLTPEIVGDREWVFDKEFFILLNVAIGGSFGGTIGLDTQFPANMYVDYVRVYQRVS